MTFIDKLYSDFEKNVFTCANPESFFLPFPVTNVYSQDVKSIFQKKKPSSSLKSTILAFVCVTCTVYS